MSSARPRVQGCMLNPAYPPRTAMPVYLRSIAVPMRNRRSIGLVLVGRPVLDSPTATDVLTHEPSPMSWCRFVTHVLRHHNALPLKCLRASALRRLVFVASSSSLRLPRFVFLASSCRLVFSLRLCLFAFPYSLSALVGRLHGRVRLTRCRPGYPASVGGRGIAHGPWGEAHHHQFQAKAEAVIGPGAIADLR